MNKDDLNFLNPGDGILNHCMISGSKDLEEVIDLGNQPLCDTLINKEDLNKKENFYPLKLMRSPVLGCSQLSHIVPGNIVYHNDYPYRPGITKEIVYHHSDQAAENISTYKIQKNSLIVDIGSNDGTLLNQYLKRDMKVIGVEPTGMADFANNNGINTLKTPFNYDVARNILENNGHAKLITATNVFAHMSQLGDVVKGIKKLLSDDGHFILENHYMVDIIKYNQYDSIYHEHIRNYSLKSIIYLFELFDMKVIHAEIVERYNGSIKVVVTKNKSLKDDGSVSKVLRYEHDSGLYESQVWLQFHDNIVKSKKQLVDALSQIKREGKTVVGNSCPGRCSTLINYCDIGVDLLPYIAEQPTSFKLNKFLPGKHIPIVDNKILAEEQPDFILLLAWHLEKPIINYLRDRGVRSKFLIPLPELKVV